MAAKSSIDVWVSRDSLPSTFAVFCGFMKSLWRWSAVASEKLSLKTGQEYPECGGFHHAELGAPLDFHLE